MYISYYSNYVNVSASIKISSLAMMAFLSEITVGSEITVASKRQVCFDQYISQRSSINRDDLINIFMSVLVNF